MTTSYRVLEAKHHAPYAGAFWEWNYWLISFENDQPFTITPIYVSGKDRLEFTRLKEMWQAHLAQKDEGYVYPLDHASFYDLDDDLEKQIPTNLVPDFWKFFNEPGHSPIFRQFIFRWTCEHSESLTSNPPHVMSGYRGNGGVGIEVDGWVCDDCMHAYAYAQSIEWCAEELRFHFDEWFPDLELEELETVAKEVIQRLSQAHDWEYIDTDGTGRYPATELVRTALLELGYCEPEEAVE